MNKNVAIWLIACGGLLLLGSGADVYGLEIIYPRDGTYVTKSNYLILKGGQDPFLDGMSIEINGVKSDVIDLTAEDYRKLFADMLLLEPIFDPGENKVTVEGFVNGKKSAEAEATIFYYADASQPAPTVYEKEGFHLAEREEPCRACHDMQPAKTASAEPIPSANPCAGCHQRMLQMKHVHGPAGAFQCLYCHESGSTPLKYAVRAGDSLVCSECHTEEVQSFNRAGYVHGPVEAGLCLVCHDPHASSQPAQLLAKVNALCLSCHSKVFDAPHVTSGTSETSHPLEGAVNPLDKQKAFNCSSCHDPHGGSHASYFIDGVTGRMQLCAKCHRK